MPFSWTSQHTLFLQKQGHYRGKSSEQRTTMGLWDSQCKPVCRGKVVSRRLLSSKLLAAAGLSTFGRLPATLSTLFLYHYNIILCREHRRLPIFPSFTPPGVNDTGVMAHSCLHKTRHEGRGKERRKEERERGGICHHMQLGNAALRSRRGNSSPQRGKLRERELGRTDGWVDGWEQR